MTHLFIALGQNHINNFEALIKNGSIKAGTYLLIAPKGLTISTSLWSTIIGSNVSFDNQAKGVFQQAKSIFRKTKEYKRIIKIISEYNNTPLIGYIAYIEDILSNYLFFSFKKEIPIVIVEDGTLNYYKHTLQNISSLKFTLKKIIASLYGIPFKKYKGHSSGASYHSRVMAQFLTLPKEAYEPKNAQQLPIKTIEINRFSDDLYIVGQEAFGNIIGQEHFINELSLYFRLLTEQPFYKEVSIIYYKPHRNGVRISKEFIQRFFSEKQVQIINSSKTSETIYFEALKCKYISSFNSSTLINIYAAMKSNTRASITYYVYPLMRNELTMLFKKLKFKFLKE